jgi:uncharacterized protein
MKNALIVFVKNPELGKVKTRLAKDIGNQNALYVYKLLIEKTHQLVLQANETTFVYYADQIFENDAWQGEKIIKKLQDPDLDLGKRMHAAFTSVVKAGYKNILIIGSDNYEITHEYITKGFECLSKKDAIIGLAKDGGYYELGISANAYKNNPQILDQLFLNKLWSHQNVGNEAITVFESHNLAFEYLPTLRDIDTVEDLRVYPELMKILRFLL